MKRPFYGWLAADGISLTGTRVSMLALPFFALSTTGSPEKTGLVAVFELLPLVALKVLGGPVIDRLGSRRVALSCQSGSFVVVGLIPVLHHLGVLSFAGFLGLVALAGALRGPGDAATYAMTPALAVTAEVPLERVTGLHSTMERTASMLGAAAAGTLIATIGSANAIAVDAASFGVCAAVLAWATVGLGTAPEEPDDGPFLRQLNEGWQFLRHDRVLVGITVMISLTNFLDLAWSGVMMPVWGVLHGGGAAVVGALFATFAGGSTIGSLVAAARADRLPRFATYLVCFLITGLPRFLVMAVDSPRWLIFGYFAVAGVASGFLNPILGAVIYERIPAPLMGRVSSLSSACCWALMPLGGLLGGFLVGGAGLSAALLICGAAYFLVTMLPAVDPRWREIDKRPSPPGAGEVEEPVVGLQLTD